MEYKIEVQDNINNDINLNSFRLVFNSYEESIDLQFFKKNGKEEEFIKDINNIILNRTKFYFNTKLKNIITKNRTRDYSKRNHNNNLKYFSPKKSYKKIYVKDEKKKLNNNLKYFSKTIKNNRYFDFVFNFLYNNHYNIDYSKKLKDKEASIEDIFGHNLEKFFIEEMKKKDYEIPNQKTIYIDKWGIISLNNNEIKLNSFN